MRTAIFKDTSGKLLLVKQNLSELLKSINECLETCGQLLFMLLQDLFGSARSHRVHKNFLLPKSALHYFYCLKLNDIMNKRKTRFIHDWFGLFNSKISCTDLILVNGKYLLYILYIYSTSWLKVISFQDHVVRRLVGIHYGKIHELASLRYLWAT